MKIIGIVPARMESSRFPGKPLADLLGMPMIGHVYHRCKMSTIIDEVYVATCNKEIYDYIRMLDAPTYPKAFLTFGELRLEFKDANFLNDEISASVTFKRSN